MCCSENIIIPCEITGRMIHTLVYFIQGLGSTVYFAVNDRTVSGKSIIGVLSLGLDKGNEIKISVVNEDEITVREELWNIIRFVRDMGES